LIASNEFDQYLHFFRAFTPDFHSKLQRNIQPNKTQMLDMIVTNEGQIKLLSMADDEFIIDQIMLNTQNGQLNTMSGHQTYTYTPVRAFSANWPYITFSGLENFLLLINVYNRPEGSKQLLHRI
jgi:hypothetical protein